MNPEVKVTTNGVTVEHAEAARSGDIWRGRWNINSHCYVTVIEAKGASFVTYLLLSGNGKKFTEDAVRFYYSFNKVA